VREVYSATRILIPNADGTRIEVRLGTGVAVEDGRITAVGPLDELRADADEVHDFGPDSTLLPGLIDSHVHLALDASPTPLASFEASDRDGVLALMLHSARGLLSAGVTTARDLGAPDLVDQAVKRAIDSGLARGPRMLMATAPITVTGGHCWFFGGECEGVDGVRRRVRQARRDGADVIKVMSSGGNLTPGSRPTTAQFTQEELDAIVEEAHRLDLKVTAHAHGENGIERAILAGVDSIEHFSFQREDKSRIQNPELVRLAAERGVAVCPTFSISLAHYMQGQEYCRFDLSRSLLDSGIRVIAGSDSGIANNPPHEYVCMLEAMAAFGMTNEETLLSATAVAADVLGVSDAAGRLEPGMPADLLVVVGDPLEDLGALRNIEIVVTRGVPYTPEFRSVTSWNDIAKAPRYDPESASSRR
jgi:imidazolonepropionase-like amidohydrolase